MTWCSWLLKWLLMTGLGALYTSQILHCFSACTCCMLVARFRLLKEVTIYLKFLSLLIPKLLSY